MKKYSLILILLVGILDSLKGQSYIDIYEKGYILTNNDTVECLVKLQSSYENKIPYKFDNNGKKFYAKIDTVNYVITNYNSYGKVRYKNKKIIARILCWGRINYYEFVSHNPPVGDPSKGWVYEKEVFTYYIEKDSLIIKIPKKKITDDIKLLFSDYDVLYKEIESKKMKSKELLKLIQEYNNAH